mmetsp:Transcript_66348/g.76974  ORF Transcript_66348/g.76974 Transcript_66348/m.76974 type:complete len:81 (+) Transcript_66348:1032-1274(+)
MEVACVHIPTTFTILSTSILQESPNNAKRTIVRKHPTTGPERFKTTLQLKRTSREPAGVRSVTSASALLNESPRNKPYNA